MGKMVTRNCKNCGKKFTYDNKKHRNYCTKKCRLDYYRNKKVESRTKKPYICVWCHTEIDHKSKFCGRLCDNTFHTVRRRIYSIFSFEREKAEIEIKKLEQLGNDYTFPPPHQDLNALYNLGDYKK